MTHWRSNTSGRPTAGAHRQPSARAGTPRDLSNSSDRDFGAFCFALFGLTCPFAFVGFAITVYLLFR
jgi:hypothetical protein